MDWGDRSWGLRGTGLPPHSTGNEEYVCHTGDLLKHLKVLPWPVIKVNGKLQNPILRTDNGSDSSRIKIWVIPLGKDSGLLHLSTWLPSPGILLKH